MKLLSKFKENILLQKELLNIPYYDDVSETQSAATKSLFQTVRSKHAAYIKNVSSPGMAMSLELAFFILSFCIKNKPALLLDLGSGFSSYIFRLYQKHETSKNVEIYSVDDNKQWLDKTKAFLAAEGLNTNNVITLEQLSENGKLFDCILLDLNFIEVRKDYIKFSADLLQENGLAIIDDVHKIEFLREVKKIAKQNNYKLFNIKKNTIDDFGRFAIVLTK